MDLGLIDQVGSKSVMPYVMRTILVDCSSYLSQNTGVSLEFGRAMGTNEPVTPVFPNSDFWYAPVRLSRLRSNFPVALVPPERQESFRL